MDVEIAKEGPAFRAVVVAGGAVLGHGIGARIVAEVRLRVARPRRVSLVGRQREEPLTIGLVADVRGREEA